MPFGDGTGPWGYGPMSGRAAGYCAGYPLPGSMNPWGGRGFGWRGRGRGWRHCSYATGVPGWARFGYGPWPGAAIPPAWAAANHSFIKPDPSQEAEYLKQRASFLKKEMAEIQKRLDQLEAESKEEEK